jgi:hypothetical protein
MKSVERKPNTRAVYIDALVSTVEELKIKLKSFYCLISEMKQKNIAKDFEREAEEIAQLESFFISEEGKEKLNKKAEADVFYWKLLSQTKAEYNRFRNRKIDKHHAKDNMKRVVSVRGINKLNMAISCHADKGGGFYKGEVLSIDGKSTTSHLMIIDVIATEFNLGLESGRYAEGMLSEYVFRYPWEAEAIISHVKQKYQNSELICVTLNNERIRRICGKHLEGKEINRLISETAEIQMEAYFFAYISNKEVKPQYRLRNKLGSRIYDFEILQTKDKRGNVIDEYIICLNTTVFGCLLINNIVNRNFDFVSPVLYQLSGFAQNIFRKIVGDSFDKFQIKERNLFAVINSFDKNKTKIRYRVQAALDELKDRGFIKSYKVLEGKDGLVYHINKYSKKAKNSKGNTG